jgi:hypothetical protein
VVELLPDSLIMMMMHHHDASALPLLFTFLFCVLLRYIFSQWFSTQGKTSLTDGLLYRSHDGMRCIINGIYTNNLVFFFFTIVTMVTLLLLSLLSLSTPVRAFGLSSICHRKHVSCLSVSIQHVSDKLLWEILEDRQRSPVLDLSRCQTSLEDPTEPTLSTVEWDQGQLWEKTQQGLRELGLVVLDALLDSSPQLYRLQPDVVLETAGWLVQEFDVDFIKQEPKLLTYKCSDVKYGLNFMSQMMMSELNSTKLACCVAPGLLLSGIDGGLQERAVKKALGEAGDATYQANQRIVGDAATAWNELKNRRKKGM